MKRVIFITFAYFCAQVMCQNENEEGKTTEKIRPSMLSMLSKYIEMNGTIDEVIKGSMTESYGGVWLNATARPINGMCETEETYVEEVTITDRIPYQVEVDVWCWPAVRCTEYETHHREEIRKENVTKTRKIPRCCEHYEMNPETKECEAICMTPCENFGTCSTPDVCKCEYGYEGQYCETDTLPEGVLTGPNVCEREEMREEVVRVMEQELVEMEVKEWCWPKIRCSKYKMEAVPVEKLQKFIKPHRVQFCCDGYAKNFKGNRCFPVQFVEDNQQQIEVN
ncbi:CLUMA_CG019563, isoform A [Clunio marinus]|uniref:CLUMA_CG019563, isoform A n=1 Tax=Clunio marinus TaxID=568069 RepID=A0A1J1J475_9DIPT|nr:CLUMA_CG019563, isoform A [Clunio marinus]